MKYMKMIFAVAAVMAFTAGSVKAGVVGSFVGGLGAHVEEWNDRSFETVIVGGADGSLDVGDVLFGIAQIESIGDATTRLTTNSSAPTEVTAIFSAQVTSKVALGGGFFLFEFDPFAGFEAVWGDGAMAAFFEDTPPDFSELGTLAASVATAADGLHLLTIGFAGEAGEAWTATANDDTAAALGSFFASLNRIISPGFANDLAGLDIAVSQASILGGGLLTQFFLSGQVFDNRDSNSNTTWPIRDSADLFFEIVPEPASIVAWGLLGAVGLVVGYRRRISS